MMRILLVADLKCFKLPELAAALYRRGAVTFRLPPTRLTRAATHDADLIILDLGLPYHESVAICREVRTMSEIPIIMISDRSQRTDRIQALRAGADDYVAHPYDLDELIARIIAATRPRGRTRGSLSTKLANGNFGDIEIDLERMRVTIAGKVTELTKKEFQMLALIAGEGGDVCPRMKLATQVWGRTEREVYDSIQVLMSRLRAKVGHERIKTVRSVGYQLVTTSNQQASDSIRRDPA
jgi:DNA-binding response OmpR family regulator